MFKPVAVFILSIFLLWLLPLGYFIKPSYEQIACGGKRALCMCRHEALKLKPVKTGMAFSLAISAVEKDASASAGGMSYLEVNIQQRSASIKFEHFYSFSPDLSSLLIARAIEHVPKA